MLCSIKWWGTTVKAEHWLSTLNAVLDAWVHIIKSDKTDWKKEEFRKAINEKYDKYLVQALEAAWKKLPESHKCGRGRPKEI